MRYDKTNNILIMSKDESTIVVEAGAKNIYIGEGCNDIKIDGKCEFISIGDNNTALDLKGDKYVEVGDNNHGLTILSSKGVLVGLGNRDIIVNTSHGNMIFTGCNGVDVSTTASNIKVDKSREVFIKSEFSKVVDSKDVIIDKGSMLIDVDKTSGLKVIGSLSSTSKDSINVTIDKTNNSKVKAADLNVLQQRSFRDYSSLQDSRVVCRLKGEITSYGVNKDNGDIRLEGAQQLIDCPVDDKGIYARYKGQWIDINELITGPVDDSNMYARYKGQWVSIRAVDPSLPPLNPPKATNSVDPDSLIPQNPEDFIVKQ